MRIHKKILLLVFFIVLIPFTGLSDATRAQSSSPVKLDPKRVPWTQLLYSAETFSAEVTSEVQLESLPAAEAEAALIKSPRGIPIEAAQPEFNKLTVNYHVDSIFRPPVKTINQVWFNPRDASALGRMRMRRGNDDFKKIYRFTDQGVFRHQMEPKDQRETSKQPEQWSAVKDTFYAHDMDQLGCHNVTERLVLIYIASAAELSTSMQPVSFCVFGRRQLFHVQLKPQGLETLEVDYIEKKQHSEVHRRSEVKALKIAIEAQPLASDLRDVEDFSFLGFAENIALFIDSVSGLPIQISGKIPIAGQVTIKLHEVRLR